ncbi:hypothetical protein M8C21_017555 [Ambrosia artemisiifolia]|uniref:Alpha 1,4-glycosyltransferase domain-containing protein n=1 Tax=Ambrosia artemisiifolia TaxID=4212 RepID=A0AAD5D9Y7_AMBAR|nr:hypothetical protein M8C21_017555 [Ambrosia artemisiifolia]
MLKKLRSRRRPHSTTHLCALTAALLLLLSATILYIRLQPHHHHHHPHPSDPLLQDSDPTTTTSSNDPIDLLDNDPDPKILDYSDDDDNDDDDVTSHPSKHSLSKYYYDHFQGVIRRGFDKRSIDQWEDYVSFHLDNNNNNNGVNVGDDLGFGSDDVVLDDNVRRKLVELKGVEDVLLLSIGGRVSPLKEGWGDWFEKKSDFLRRDRMFKSNLELLNPMSNPLLQDPDLGGGIVAGLTKGDKLIQKRIVSEFKKVPFVTKRPSGSVSANNPVSKGKLESEIKIAERRTLDEKGEFSGQIYADGKRWGYFPGLHPRLSFSNFMDGFFRKGKCLMRVFMVWNSPPWMFSVRHQRGLESVLFHHPDACVVVFSETLELNFFDGFVKDGFKVAVAMPNLDELLKDTPTHEFANVWFEWRKTKFYPTHYSELIRLVALYKYGGIYLDSDVIVIKPLHSLSNVVGLEDESSASDVNGAVMAFKKHSLFIMECLKEFYASYDDTNLRWNGADLLTRVGKTFLREENGIKNEMELKLQPVFAFFPISRKNITRYFTQPTTDAEKADQDALYQKIVDEALVFHFWNSITSGLVPEPESLAARLIDQHCIRCSDML